MPQPSPEHSTEHDDLRRMLDEQRWLLSQTVTALSPEQLALTPTVSTLSLGSILAHLAVVEGQWLDRLGAPPAVSRALLGDGAPFPDVAGAGREDLLAAVTEAGQRTADWLAGEPDLSQRVPLPVADWFPPGGTWSRRQVIAHLLREIAQHSGHADIIRESIDGQRTMG